jgi:cysteine desulfurase
MTPEPLVYLDHAAATPLSAAAWDAMLPYYQDQFYNPSATYLPAKQVRGDLSAARQVVAGCLGAQSAEVVFVAGGTEANNLAIHGVLRLHPDGEIVTSAIEHDSVLETAAQYAHKTVRVNGQGLVDVADVVAAISERTVLVSVMYANNEVGSVQPIRQLAAELVRIRSARKQAGNDRPLLFHTDAAQAANYLDIHVARLGVDMMTLNGGKIYGPKQSGILYVRGVVSLAPLLYGGGQERGLRSGTENVAAAIGFAAALAEATNRRHDEAARLQLLRAECIKALQDRIPQATVFGSTKKTLPNVLSVLVPGTDNERVLLQLEQDGILAAAGSACSASNDEPSHVLTAMGVPEADIRSTIRFSMGRGTTQADIRRLVDALSRLFA